MELFLDGNMPASVVELPAGEDPDSFLRKEGGQSFAARLAAARPIFDFFFRQLLRQADTGNVAGKVKVVEEITPRLAKIANPIERDLYIREIARMLGGVKITETTRKPGRLAMSAASPARSSS